MNYYLGIDIGTTSVKAVAFDVNGDLLLSQSVEYGMQHPQASRSEQDPVEIYDAFISVTRDTMRQLKGKPAFISFSAAMLSIMAVDHNGEPLTPLIIWADNRAASIATSFTNNGQADFFYHRTGVPVHAMSPLLKLFWLKENEPGIYNAAHKFIGIKEYIFHRLLGYFIVDASIASATGLLNLHTLEWEEEILELLSLETSKLSEVVSAKSVFYILSNDEQLAFLSHIPMVIGASDGALANAGTDARNDILAITIGTSGAARCIVNSPVTDKGMRHFCYHVKEDEYIIGGANNNGAVVLQWLKEQVLESGESYEELFAEAAAVKPGSDGLIVLPYILGERAPFWNSSAKGVFFGVTRQHTKAHFLRAVMEGVVFSMVSIAQVLQEKNVLTAVYASGGFVKSELWLQILADVLQLPVHVSGAMEASAYGAVILGAEALMMDAKFDHRILRSFYPAGENSTLYRQAFSKFERLYELLKVEMTDQEQLSPENKKDETVI